jgi:hypothetical protein
MRTLPPCNNVETRRFEQSERPPWVIADVFSLEVHPPLMSGNRHAVNQHKITLANQ